MNCRKTLAEWCHRTPPQMDWRKENQRGFFHRSRHRKSHYLRPQQTRFFPSYRLPERLGESSERLGGEIGFRLTPADGDQGDICVMNSRRNGVDEPLIAI